MKAPLDIFADGVRDGVYPGGQLAISREGVRLVSEAHGTLGPGLPPTRVDALYDLASLTKPLATAILVGRALERGRLGLDAPLWRSEARETAPTIAQALDHSTGFPAHARFDLRLPPEVSPGTWDAFRFIVAAVRTTPLERAPGQAAVYSDLGYILLGAALEDLEGQPISALHCALGTRLSYRDRRDRAPPEVRDHDPPFAPTEDGLTGAVHDENARAMGGAAGHAGLFGTAEAVLAVAEDLVAAYHGQRDRLLAPETVRRLWAPSPVTGSTRTLGWDRPSAEGSSTGGRWPLHSVGHLGFTGTSLWIEPERALIAVLVTNRVCPTRANNAIRALRPELHDAIWEAWGR